ncbi:flagellar hook protein [Spirochaetia bacterium]|nr:flagellar hook protein [Spirochaetia bacterium]
MQLSPKISDSGLFPKTGAKKAASKASLGAFGKMLDGLTKKTERIPAKLDLKKLIPAQKTEKTEKPVKMEKPAPAQKTDLIKKPELTKKMKTQPDSEAVIAVSAPVPQQQKPVHTPAMPAVSGTEKPEPKPEKIPVLQKKAAPIPERAETKPLSPQIQAGASAFTIAKNSAPEPTVKTPEKKQSQRIVAVHDQRSQPLPENQPARIVSEPNVVELHTDLSRNLMEEPESADKYRPEQRFEDLLARNLRQDLSESIVQKAEVFLRDAGAGTVRLSLYPESLGKVKVNLSMVENRITGHIIVESPEALRAFEREVHSLEQAFRDSGFQTANLSTSLAGGNGQGAQQSDQPESQFFSSRVAEIQYNADEPAAADSQINMLA